MKNTVPMVLQALALDTGRFILVERGEAYANLSAGYISVRDRAGRALNMNAAVAPDVFGELQARRLIKAEKKMDTLGRQRFKLTDDGLAMATDLLT